MTLRIVQPGEDPGVPRIELRSVEDLIPYHANARTHNPAQVTAIATSLLEWGWTNAALVDANGGIIAGHGRIMAAAELYKQGKAIRFANGSPIPIGKVPVMNCDGWTEQQRKAYILADNQLAMLAGWDLEMLKGEVDLLQAGLFDMEKAGFSDDFLAELFADLVPPPAVGNGEPDEAPPVPDIPTSVPGDVWVCGPHLVCCGSALSIEDWDRMMRGDMADAVWTDPPYNVDIGAKNVQLDKSDKGNRGKTGAIMNDKMSNKDFYEFLFGMYETVLTQMKAGAPIYVAHADVEGVNFRKAFTDAGFKLQSVLIWNKNVHVLGRWDYQPKHEPIIYGWKPGAAHKWYGGRKNKTVVELGEAGPFTQTEDGRWQIKVGDSVLIVSGDAEVEEHPSSVIFEPKPSKSGLHPTQKPVALIERMLKNSAREGDIVADEFGGSGSTMIACERLRMRARLMELDPKFVDVIVQRWQDFTGLTARHLRTDEPFPAKGETRPAPLPAEPVDADGEIF
jgi:DNA modification methylase